MDNRIHRIHPTAVISDQAELAADVQIGAFAVLEGMVRLGPGCMVHPHACLVGPLTIGRDNSIQANVVLGERPQHAGYRDELTGVQIGNGNVFSTGVTIHRATEPGAQTCIGDSNLFLPGSHVGHDCAIGNHCTLGSYALLAGHCKLADHVTIGPGAAVHQYCRLGRLSVLGARSATTKDIPPFIVQQGRNVITGVNEEGMQHQGITREQIIFVHRVYDIIFLHGLSFTDALAQAARDLGPSDILDELAAFVRLSKRGGINRIRMEKDVLSVRLSAPCPP